MPSPCHPVKPGIAFSFNRSSFVLPAFIETYLRLDEDGDYVVRSLPCPFLGADNYCSIYEVRPSDCERFPYTDEDTFMKRPAITQKNSTFCPIVYFVLEGLMGVGG